MRESGLEIERSRQPSSLVLSEDEKEIESFDGYPVKVVSFYKYAPLDPPADNTNKVVVHSLDAPEGEEATEVVRAKYVIGSDGTSLCGAVPLLDAYSLHRCSLMGEKATRVYDGRGTPK